MLQKILFLLLNSIIIACSGPPPNNHPRATGLSPKKILLKNQSNNYIRLHQQTPYILIADSPKLDQADTFNLCNLNNDIVSLESKGLYVTVHLQQKNQAILRQKHIETWEKLTLEKHGDLVAFKGCNNKYLCPSDRNVIAATSSTLQSSCLFRIIEL